MGPIKLIGEDPEGFDDQLAAVDFAAPFYIHFGRFMNMFAMVEGQFHAFFRRHSGLAEPTARAIVSGFQIGKIASICNGVVQASSWDASQKREFQDLIDQINVISDFRHTLVHRGADRVVGEITSTNELTAKSKETVEILRFNISHIKDASIDLVRIVMKLVILPHASLQFPPESGIPQLLAQSWRYKRIAPDKPNQPPRRDDQ